MRSSHEVVGKVKWMSPVNESAERAVEVSCFCQPERRQPAPRDKMKACDYDRNTDCHPFWHIRRSNVVGTFNSAVVGVEITVITSSSMAKSQTARFEPIPGCLDYVVTLPYIVNTQKIAGGDEIVLRWEKKTEDATRHPKKRDINAFPTFVPEKKPKFYIKHSVRAGGQPRAAELRPRRSIVLSEKCSRGAMD